MHDSLVIPLLSTVIQAVCWICTGLVVSLCLCIVTGVPHDGWHNLIFSELSRYFLTLLYEMRYTFIGVLVFIHLSSMNFLNEVFFSGG